MAKASPQRKKRKKCVQSDPTTNAIASRRKNLVIGLTGPIGSGCSEMAKQLVTCDNNFKLFKISDDIKLELEPDKSKWQELKKDADWRAKQQLRGNFRRKQTEDRNCRYWVDKILKRIDEANIDDAPLVIDGIRNYRELEEFRREFYNFFLVAVCAEQNERWERIREKEYSVQGFDNFLQFNRDDLKDRGDGHPWGQTVQKCVNQADYVFFNNEQLLTPIKVGQPAPSSSRIQALLTKEIKKFLPPMEGTKNSYGPSPHELQMASAYALSDASSCQKRHVGAVITINRNGRELPVSMGYNENPCGAATCADNGDCKKDGRIYDFFARISDDANLALHCPNCGTKHEKPSVETLCDCEDYLKTWFWPTRGMEYCTAIHAEERAILSLGDRSADGGKMYVTTFPCFQCARIILDVGIKEVIYLEAYPSTETKQFLEDNGCGVISFTGFTARAFFRVFQRIS